MGRWLPEGQHRDLHIEHAQAVDPFGTFTGGGWKLDWHMTVSPWNSVEGIVRQLRQRFPPHLVIGGRFGTRLPVVVQLLPFDVPGRALGNDQADGKDTNRSNCIQVEICWNPGVITDPTPLPDRTYKALANMVRLVNETIPHNIPAKLARDFSNTKRFSDAGFVRAEGHLGHMHTPDNDHWDPSTRFRGRHLMNLLHNMPSGGYDLHPLYK